MNVNQPDHTESEMQQQVQRSRRYRPWLRWVTLATTVIIIVLLGIAIYQVVATGQFTPLFWIVIGLIALMVVFIYGGKASLSKRASRSAR